MRDNNGITGRDELGDCLRSLKSRLQDQMPEIPAWVPQGHESVGPVSLANAGTLEKVRAILGNCTRCRLHEGRRKIVFGQGNPHARLMFVGEGPGADEDRQGLAFVGKAGQLLTRIIEAIGLTREEVYIANIVKCRPPNNRDPKEDEVETCFPFLEAQIRAIRPTIICALGAPAARTLLGVALPISRLRGKFFDLHGIQVMPTYHPAYLLRNPEAKRLVWEDVQKVQCLYHEIGEQGAYSEDSG
ncbi:MAG: uracil-DNA glycosylase [bacterium]|nr:uracil-DNA glycosylase [bacterium]